MLRRHALRGSRGVLGAPSNAPSESSQTGSQTESTRPTASATCFWITSSSLDCLARVAPEVGRELSGAVVEIGPAVPPPVSDEAAEGSGSSARQADVADLARIARAVVRSGISVLVAHPLLEAAERDIARREVGGLVEVSLDGSESSVREARDPVPYDANDPIAPADRTNVNPDPATAAGPEVVVDGRRGSPTSVAAGIVDVLRRAGWLTNGEATRDVARDPEP